VIAQQFAVDHPGRVDRLVLISCSNRFGPYLRDMAALLGQSLYRFPYTLFMQTMEMLGTAPEFYDAHQEEMRRRIEQSRSQRISKSAVVEQLHCLAISEIDESCYRIQSPTLVIAGEYDAIIPNCYARRMCEEIDGCYFITMRGCGHNPPAEAPQRVLPLIRDFLQGRAVDAEYITSTSRSRDGERDRGRGTGMEASAHMPQTIAASPSGGRAAQALRESRL
jgi:pimeloyl-ACP methyl ester carboxylesterase